LRTKVKREIPEGAPPMPGYFSYLGKLDSPGFFWKEIPDANFGTGNTPDRIIPKEWDGLGFAPGLINSWTKEHGLDGMQIDWGAWGMIVRKSDIEAIWKEQKDPNERPWQDEKKWQSIWEQIETLQDDETYVLVVAENP